jgi:hypothetical protein
MVLYFYMLWTQWIIKLKLLLVFCENEDETEGRHLKGPQTLV